MSKTGLHSIAEVSSMIAQGRVLLLACDEKLLSQLPAGKWIGGTSVNFVADAGGTTERDRIFVTDITQRGKIWRARREVFAGDFPASTLVQVAALAEPSVKLEIEAIAHIGAGKR